MGRESLGEFVRRIRTEKNLSCMDVSKRIRRDRTTLNVGGKGGPVNSSRRFWHPRNNVIHLDLFGGDPEPFNNERPNACIRQGDLKLVLEVAYKNVRNRCYRFEIVATL